jgi:hypothetical protein
MLEEAGCPATGFDGSPYRPFSGRSLVTGAPGAAEELRRLVAPCYQAEGGYKDSVPD